MMEESTAPERVKKTSVEQGEKIELQRLLEREALHSDGEIRRDLRKLKLLQVRREMEKTAISRRVQGRLTETLSETVKKR